MTAPDGRQVELPAALPETAQSRDQRSAA